MRTSRQFSLRLGSLRIGPHPRQGRRECASSLAAGTLAARTLAAGLLLLGTSCDSEKKPSYELPANRGDAVQAKPSAAQGTSTTTPVVQAESAAAPKPARAFCSPSASVGQKLSTDPVSQRSADSFDVLPETVETGNGSWTWINLWAAWCVPCKQEMPLLKSWEKQLATSQPFRLTFVSLDDDERQLAAFLKAQPAIGVRKSYWLREGKERDTWLKAVKVDSDIALPAHILVDGKGKVRCFINGAVEAADLAKVQQVIAG